MWHIREAIVVEGKYDAIRLRSLVDAPIVETGGFRIFKDDAQLALLRRLARTRGLVVLTDSDSAGFVIRGHLNGVLPPSQIKQAYVPARRGKERRKTAPSAEGLLGVEGMRDEELLTALRRAGVIVEEQGSPSPPFLTAARLYEDGFCGGTDSRRKREALCSALELPPHLSTPRLLEVLNTAFSEEEYEQAKRALADPPIF